MIEPGALTALAELGERETELLAQVLARVRSDFPSYADVRDEALESSFRQNIEMCSLAVTDPAAPQSNRLYTWARIARRRFEAGVPIDDLIRSYTFSIGLIADELTALFGDHGVPTEKILETYRTIRNVIDAYTAALAAEYRQHRIQLDTHTHELKMDVIERLKTGSFEEPLVSKALARFRLNTELHFRAFTARPSPNSDIDIYSLMALIESQLIGGRGISVIHTDQIIGITVHEFTPMPEVSVSYGHRSRLDTLASSFDTAEQVAATSGARTEGNHTLEESSWRIAVVAQTPLIDHLQSRFLAPLHLSKVGEGVLLHSVHHFLRHNRSYRQAAQFLHCHPNTLRYRISRFEELTGTTISNTETIIALEWMFEAQSRL
ncbi:helix-turn-helix domain-containing protein [Brevibacterium sp. ZH18]|uniref:helix-turn-helix domain-containing protein n=1 Tax=Brevibacterium sp. ZH18 TaxID=2927784 RepID=UPI001F619852|nr:helix-turn-helix domain-containing protein [Brevibacterium sp. ZH18]MCI4011154.1 helix-turn-helix domain-containing protein [Brevibacterium sp. ZH18]